MKTNTINRTSPVGLKWIMSLGLMGATTLFAQEREASIPADPQTGKPSTSAIAEDPHLTMNFEGVPLQSVLEYMSEAADLIILGETKVEGKVNILSKQPLNREEAVELLIVVLNENGYAAIRRGERMLKIVGKDKALIEDLPVRSGANPEDIPKNDLMVTQIIPIRFGNAGQLIENISELLPEYATISANEGSNAIILTDTQTNIHRIAQIVSALDTSISSISEIKVFPLAYADAKQLADVIKGLFQSSSSGSSRSSSSRGSSSGIAEMMRARFGGGSTSSRDSGSRGGRSSRGGGGSEGSSAALAAASRVVAISEERTNSLVISAPSDVIPTIEQLVKEMDRTIEDVTEIQVFKLKNADAYEMAEVLTNLFSDKDEIENSRGGFRFGSSRSSSRSGSSSSGNSSERMLQQKKVVAVADPRTNSVIVSATAELMTQIALMVERLDDNKAKQQKVYTYSLQNADVEGVSEILRNMFEQQNGNFNSTRNRSSSNQQNPLDNRRVSDPQSSGGFSSQR